MNHHLCFAMTLCLTGSAATPPGSLPQIPPPVSMTLQAQINLDHATRGDDTAQFFLGRRYCLGVGVPRDYAEAAKWFRKAAEQDHADAQCELGYLLEVGVGVPKDPSEALRWYRSAAERGHAAALDSLGAMYFRGIGVPTNRVRGFMYLLAARACSGWSTVGEFEQQMTNEEILRAKLEVVEFLKKLRPLSTFLQDPLAPKEPEPVEEAYQETPDPESPRDRQAIILLGSIDHGMDGASDRIPRRIKLLKDLSKHGVPYAQLQLGRAYEIGEGVPKDHVMAAQLYRKAAEQGNADAQYNLAMMYSEGDGVPKDNNEAQRWFSAAATAVKPAQPWSPTEKLQDEIERRNTRLAKSSGSAYKFFLIARYAGNPEAQAQIDKLEKTLTKNDAAACRYHAEFVWVRIRPE